MMHGGIGRQGASRRAVTGVMGGDWGGAIPRATGVRKERNFSRFKKQNSSQASRQAQ